MATGQYIDSANTTKKMKYNSKAVQHASAEKTFHDTKRR